MGKKLFDVVFSPISLIVGDKIGHAITGAFLVAAGIATGNLQLAALGIGMAASSFAKKPGVNKANLDRLSASLDPGAPRKIVFGTTAMATDVRYQTYTGANQDVSTRSSASPRTRCSRSTRSGSRTRRPGRLAGGAQGRFAGYLTVTPRTSAPAPTASRSTRVDRQQPPHRLRLCLPRYKLTGNSSKATSPFSSGVPSRMTIRGNGALVYDPRLDSTVTGGSGSQRAAIRRPGPGRPRPRATRRCSCSGICSGGGSRTRRRRRGGSPSGGASRRRGSTCRASSRPPMSATRRSRSPPAARSRAIAATASSRKGTIRRPSCGMLLGAMNASLRDAGGKLALVCWKNDLGTPVASFTEADIIGGDSWEQTPGFDKMFNIVRGRFTDPSDNALYQLSDYPEVSIASLDTIDRIATVDFAMVQSSAQAQRLAKQYLQRNQYQGRFSATFHFPAWQVSLGDPSSSATPRSGGRTSCSASSRRPSPPTAACRWCCRRRMRRSTPGRPRTAPRHRRGADRLQPAQRPAGAPASARDQHHLPPGDRPGGERAGRRPVDRHQRHPEHRPRADLRRVAGGGELRHPGHRHRRRQRGDEEHPLYRRSTARVDQPRRVRRRRRSTATSGWTPASRRTSTKDGRGSLRRAAAARSSGSRWQQRPTRPPAAAISTTSPRAGPGTSIGVAGGAFGTAATNSGYGSIAAARTIIWRRVAVRPASDAEKAGKGLVTPGSGQKVGDARNLPNIIGQNLGYKINARRLIPPRRERPRRRRSRCRHSASIMARRRSATIPAARTSAAPAARRSPISSTSTIRPMPAVRRPSTPRRPATRSTRPTAASSSARSTSSSRSAAAARAAAAAAAAASASRPMPGSRPATAASSAPARSSAATCCACSPTTGRGPNGRPAPATASAPRPCGGSSRRAGSIDRLGIDADRASRRLDRRGCRGRRRGAAGARS
jgi:hypothetical protein